ncbi:hypothetical protein BUALT_Bualt04G0088800 [Buddleja alternifolia]|uniref:Uncharacterized protein n=1 Tax=Buddleja alternifolia TaxID=168488 RepID=A0AAV6XRU0_9LAMI|nr:hypothetical protein BUALT_Bualt04G0088800 [Buddleja alternifolia]
MGNNIGGGKRKIKIMKIDGQIFKLKMPAKAMDVLKDYPNGYVLLESESVKRFGIRAPQLLPEEELRPKKVYFLLEIPKFPDEDQDRIRRSRSAVPMTGARERLECLMMLRQKSDTGPGPGRIRVKMRLPRAQIEKLMEESRDGAEVAERILHLCLQNSREEISEGLRN